MWRVGLYLGLVSDKPQPKIGSRTWWLNLILVTSFFLVGLAILHAVQ